MNITIIITLLSALILAAFYDLKTHRIPNLLNFTIFLSGTLYHIIINGYEGFLFSAAGAGTGIGLLFVFYLCGGMGAGDVKLMCAVGSFLGASGVFISLIYSAIFGGFYALFIIFMFKSQFKGLFTNFYFSGINLILAKNFVSFDNDKNAHQRPKLCYGLAIAVGTGIYMVCKNTGIDVLPL